MNRKWVFTFMMIFVFGFVFYHSTSAYRNFYIDQTSDSSLKVNNCKSGSEICQPLKLSK